MGEDLLAAKPDVTLRYEKAALVEAFNRFVLELVNIRDVYTNGEHPDADRTAYLYWIRSAGDFLNAVVPAAAEYTIPPLKDIMAILLQLKPADIARDTLEHRQIQWALAALLVDLGFQKGGPKTKLIMFDNVEASLHLDKIPIPTKKKNGHEPSKHALKYFYDRLITPETKYRAARRVYDRTKADLLKATNGDRIAAAKQLQSFLSDGLVGLTRDQRLKAKIAKKG